MGLCDGRVVLITGAGRGIGRAHALAFGAAGAKVVVNDLGASGSGEGSDQRPAEEVVDAIRAAGGEAVASFHDIADFDDAGRAVKLAIDTFGGLDVVVNNAGILRDRMFVSSSVDEWDAVMHVHLRGHYCVTRHACAFWRAESKAGRTPDARIINTSSGAGLLGSVGQSAYAAAKGGIASLTLVQAAELGRYGITANAIAPAARTRMTEGPFAEMMKKPDDGFDAWAPENVSPLVVWLGSSASSSVSGQIFEIQGGKLNVQSGYRPGASVDKGARFTPEELSDVVAQLLADAPDNLRPYGA
ncbi:MAG: SDR family NAD(P)-dependent oxidoreductase [Deltaproteobacteria bacterium]|nr:MAG: SDR family NAD(P)-dependent oxidoreductase [Deltaproteobacteria bacterium]